MREQSDKTEEFGIPRLPCKHPPAEEHRQRYLVTGVCPIKWSHHLLEPGTHCPACHKLVKPLKIIRLK